MSVTTDFRKEVQKGRFSVCIVGDGSPVPGQRFSSSDVVYAGAAIRHGHERRLKQHCCDFNQPTTTDFLASARKYSANGSGDTDYSRKYAFLPSFQAFDEAIFIR